MSKRKPMDKAQARERRNHLLKSAAAAELSLTEGVREMRAISGMTQEEFAQHRGVSARVIKALELGQGNPTVATLNRIGEFFGLEVGFVPVGRTPVTGKSEVHNTLADAVPRIIISDPDQDDVIGAARRLLALLESWKGVEGEGNKDISDADASTVSAGKKKKARSS